MERIKIDSPVPKARELTLCTARNEFEPFQIVIQSKNLLKDVTITISDLYNEEGILFSPKNFSLYEVHYIHVRTPSPRSGSSPGWYPDALSPFRETDINPGENKIIWVDVYTPEHQDPGTYTGTIRVNLDNPVELPLTITVWNFTLPEKTSLRSSFGVFYHEIYRTHNLDWDSPELEDIFYSYYETLINHRVMPGELVLGVPGINQDGSIDTSQSHRHLKYFFDTLHVNSCAVPLYTDWPFEDPFGKNLDLTSRYLQDLYDYYSENGWDDEFYVFVIDEPNDQKAYQDVRDIGKSLDSIHPSITFLVTEQLTPEDPSWGNLYGYVDVWCPLFFHVENEKDLISERQALGEEVWTYTALCQGEEETPFWELDYPVLNYRVTEWMIWNSRISGLLYWATNYWDKVEDPWEDPETWSEGNTVYNGEGSLLYPADDGCYPSIRLKVVREGMEDYEYFVMLKSLGEESFADETVGRIVKSWYQWDQDTGNLLEARRLLGEKIDSISREASSEEEKEEEQVEEKEEKEEQEVQEENGKEVKKEEKKEDLPDEEEVTEKATELVPEPAEPQDNIVCWISAGIISVLLVVLFWMKRK